MGLDAKDGAQRQRLFPHAFGQVVKRAEQKSEDVQRAEINVYGLDCSMQAPGNG